MYHSGYGAPRSSGGYGYSYGGNGGHGYGYTYGGPPPPQGGNAGYGNDYHAQYAGYGNGYGNWSVAESFAGMKDVNWGSVQNFVQIVKNFYQECEAVRMRSEGDVMEWRKENQVYVVGSANFKPILQFHEAGIPEYLMTIIKVSSISHCSHINLTPSSFRHRTI